MTSQKTTTYFATIYPDLRSPDKVIRDDAWARFWRTYEPRIRAWAAGMNLNGDQIDEITGRVTAKLVERMPAFDYDPSRSFSSYLRRAIQNEVIDYWRKIQREPVLIGVGGSDLRATLEQHPDSQAAVDSLSEALETPLGELEGKVRAALAKVETRVEPRTWEGFLLTTFEGLTAREAAELTGKSVASVHVAKTRIRKMLQKELEAATAE